MRLNTWEAEARARRLAYTWWRDLQPPRKPDKSDPDRPDPPARPGNRAALARLRRAAKPLEAAEEAVTVALLRLLGGGLEDFEDVAVCAAVLAHVREEDKSGIPVASRIGAGHSADPDSPGQNARPLMTPLRFRRLIEARDAGERLTQFRRLVALAGGKLDVGDLALALLDWSERRRRDWIFRYHGGEPSAASGSGAPSASEPASPAAEPAPHAGDAAP